MAEVIPTPNIVADLAKKPENIRGRDRAKMDIQWEDPELLFEANGQRVVRLHTVGDVKQFGVLMGHCAGDHTARIKKGDWNFVTILTEDNVPHATILAKHIELKNTNDGYTGARPICPEEVTIQNHHCFLVETRVKSYGALQNSKYADTFKGWLEAAKVEA